MTPPPAAPAPPAYAVDYRVAAFDLDAEARLTYPALLRYLHETAQRHADGHGFGYAGVHARGLSWALVTLHLEFAGELPRDGDALSTATSVARATGPLVLRDYVVAGPGGRHPVVGQSMWALIDQATRATTPPPPDLKAVLDRVSGSLQSDIPRVRRLNVPDAPLPRLFATAARLHDCDFNGHLNNVVTARWLLDGAADLYGVPTLRLARLRLSYHHELMRGETATVGGAVEGDTCRVEVRRGDGVLVANGEIVRT